MPAKFSEVDLAVQAERAALIEVWEASVRATHFFLSEADLQDLIPRVRQILAEYPRIHCLRAAEGRVAAFMGVAQGEIDMLFVHPDFRGTGAGRSLVEYAIRVLGAERVDVNEQNQQAVGFYQHLGFHQAGRSALDPFGKPFPILHMELRD